MRTAQPELIELVFSDWRLLIGLNVRMGWCSSHEYAAGEKVRFDGAESASSRLCEARDRETGALARISSELHQPGFVAFPRG